MPVLSRNFDGKIVMERVANYESYKKLVTCERFTDDGSMNACLRAGDWHKLLDIDEMTLGELRTSIVNNYYLDDDIASRIVLRHYQPTGKDGKSVPCYYDDEDHILLSIDHVKAGGYTLMVQYLPVQDEDKGG